MIVMKFGGTSVGSAKAIENVCNIIKNRLDINPIIVVSAVGGITDELLNSAKNAANGNLEISNITSKHNQILNDLNIDENILNELHDELKQTFELILESGNTSNKMLDRVVSFGERISSRIVAANLSKNEIKSKAYDAFDIGFVTDDNYCCAEILKETYTNIDKLLDFKNFVPVITGFIAKNKLDRITTLGRGGSDYTAAIIGAAKKANAIEIWTDVNGIKSTDPRIIPEAKTIEVMSFAEASELAYFGAKVLHPKTIIPAVENNIPVKVLNTMEPEHTGTTIIKDREDIIKGRIKAVTAKKDIKIITVTSTRMLDSVGFMEKLFCTFAKYNVVVDMIATSEVSVSATINGMTDIDQLIEELGECAKVNIEKNKAIVCVVGEGLKEVPGVSGRVFHCMGQNNINVHMISQGASEINISFVVDVNDSAKAIKKLHKEFIE